MKIASVSTKLQFYLHDRYLRNTQGIYHAGKSDEWKPKNLLLPAYEARGVTLMQVKLQLSIKKKHCYLLRDARSPRYTAPGDLYASFIGR